MATEAQVKVFNLIQQIQTGLELRIDKYPHLRAELEGCVSTLAGLNMSPETLSLEAPSKQNHGQGLVLAIDAISQPDLLDLKSAIISADPFICWREDAGCFYEDQSSLGTYVGNNLHCELLGPKGVAFKTDQIMMGLFYLASRVLYRDHQHEAPELYWTLCPRSGWRFGTDAAWQDVVEDQVVWNASKDVHATRVYDQPFLSVFAWTADLSVPPTVVPVDEALLADWQAIEDGLQG